MKTSFNLEKGGLAAVAVRGLLLALVVTLYVAGLLVVDYLSASTFLVVLAGLYFMPAVLRSWLQFYWQVGAEISVIRSRLVKN